MNARSIVFVLLCAATFFGLNLFFSHQRDQRNREYYQQLDEKQAQMSEEQKAAIAAKTAPLSSLPLIDLTSDLAGNDVVARALDVNGNALALAWKLPLPETLYARGQEMKLLTKDAILDAPVVYGSKNFKRLDIASLPKQGTYDLQLIALPPDCSAPTVTLGEYHDGTLFFPGASLKQNAIGLFKTDAGFLPLGFYDWRGNIFLELQDLPLLATLPLSKPAAEKTPVSDQKYYVLESPYQQLVFTNVGGSLIEINLPFESKENKKSVVKEIGFDRDLAENSPANARFPLHPYYTFDSKEPHTSGQVGGYYPLLRRGDEKKGIPAENYGLNIVSDYPELASQVFEVKEFTKNKIVFESKQSLRKITKTYTLSEQGAPYIFDLEIGVEGASKGLWLTSGVPEVEIMSNSSSPQIQYRLSRKGKPQIEKLDLPKVKEAISVSSITPDWIVNSNGYLGMILDPQDDLQPGYKALAIAGEVVPTRLGLIDPQYQPYDPASYPGYEVLLPLPEKGGKTRFRVYAGPFEEATLKAVDKLYSDPKDGYNPDYISSRTFYGWFSFISEPFAKFLYVVMKFFYSITSSWALSIILLTVFLRILLYPLNAWSLKSMYRMREISPEVQAIQKKYKKDPKKAQMEIMTLYREKKVNPFTGCLPILIQLPFLIGMFDLLKSSFQLRGASFIPGWIDNLTAPDVLFEWSRPIFFIGTQFHLLPIILGFVMLLQQRMSTPKKAKGEMTDQERQQRAMGTVMAVVFTVMFYHFPSGLNLYWLSSMLLGMLQQWLTNKMMAKKKEKGVSLKAKAK